MPGMKRWPTIPRRSVLIPRLWRLTAMSLRSCWNRAGRRMQQLTTLPRYRASSNYSNWAAWLPKLIKRLLSSRRSAATFCVMGVAEILEEIKSLPPEQRWQVLERTRDMLGVEIPDTFKQGMREIASGEVIELDEALQELDRPE